MTSEPSVDEDTLQELARAGSALAAVPHTRAGDGLYLAYGTAKDWFYSLGMVAITAEVYGRSNVVSYQRLWPSFLYLVYSSTAQRFNPAPQMIITNNEKWQPYLTYLLAVLPVFSFSEATALDEERVVVAFTNTGHLTPSSVLASVDGAPVQLIETDSNSYTYELSLRDGDSIMLTLEPGSLLKVAERPLPPAHFRVARSGDEITVEEGTSYTGPAPSTLFSFGYAPPTDPWGQAEWYITKP